MIKMESDWNDPRSLSSFQTFPRANKSSSTAPFNGYMDMNGVKSALSREYDLIPGYKNVPTPLTHARMVPVDASPYVSWNGLATEDCENTPLLLRISMDNEDRRFGFSVIGGLDEGFTPRIDEISTGSPADRADLEVGDEILEVNGKSLENATHTEVISHIHQCIRSRTISLRVKRKTGSKLALDLAQNSNVQDAFVIAVEQQARERLEKLSALKKIKPVDMTKLSQQLSQDSTAGSQDINGIIEANPIYVTSVPELSQTTLASDNNNKSSNKSLSGSNHSNINNNHHRDSGLASTKFGADDDEGLEKDEDSEITHSNGVEDYAETQVIEEEIELKQEIVDSIDIGVNSGSKVHRPAAAQPTSASTQDSLTRGRPIVKRIESQEMLPGSAIKPTKNHHSRSGSREDDFLHESGGGSDRRPSKTVVSAGSFDMLEPEFYENGPHREMAVDVPDSFIAATKTPPRYPPPRQHQHSLQSHIPQQPSNFYSNTYERKKPNAVPVIPPQIPHENGTLPKPVLPPKAKNQRDSGIVAKGMGTPPPQPPSRDSAQGSGTLTKPIPGPKPVIPPLASGLGANFVTVPPVRSESASSSFSSSKTPTRLVQTATPPIEESPMQMSVQDEQLERIRKYQEDIRKRREEEERIAREQEFLRTSLRGSKKLQALEQDPSVPPASGFDNTAFEIDDGEYGRTSREDHGLLPDDEFDHSQQYFPIDKIVSSAELLTAVHRLQDLMRNNGHLADEDLNPVTQLLHNPEFQKALAIHNKVQEVWCFGTPPTPASCEAQDLVQEVLNCLHECSLPEATELVDLLNKFEFEGLIYAHDKVAESEAPPAMSPDEELLDRASQYTEDSIKIVRIDKSNEPLGATVRNEGESVIVGRIVKGGAAEKSGLLHEGDEVLEVNGIEMRGKSVNDVCDILANMTGTLTFLIIPCPDDRPKQSARDNVMHVRAHFDYDPEEDLYIPCRELGISFQKGDILHVINQEDPNWWQAYREGEEDQTLAGLIPSNSFQQQREAMKQTIVGDTNNKEKSKKAARFLCARKNPKKKKKKVLYNANFTEEVDSEEILTYEEVALYYPRANRKRPIVLIGPPNIGRHELRQKLMEDMDRFAAAVPHTSRPKKDGEVDGQDCYFITRQQFEADIVSRKFVEHGEYEKNYYGTSLDAIRTVVNSGKICVLNLHPQSLKILKASDLKPFVVFVAPPSLEKLRQNRAKMNANIKDEELKEIIEKAREMEENYGHYFDMVIINMDLDRAYNQLLQEINVLEREPQWVPAAWLKNDVN